MFAYENVTQFGKQKQSNTKASSYRKSNFVSGYPIFARDILYVCQNQDPVSRLPRAVCSNLILQQNLSLSFFKNSCISRQTIAGGPRGAHGRSHPKIQMDTTGFTSLPLNISRDICFPTWFAIALCFSCNTRLSFCIMNC